MTDVEAMLWVLSLQLEQREAKVVGLAALRAEMYARNLQVQSAVQPAVQCAAQCAVCSAEQLIQITGRLVCCFCQRAGLASKLASARHSMLSG
jgi:hypothetical protein